MGKVATIVLNRNLPEVTDQLCENLNRYNSDSTDVFVVEAGSDKDKLSTHATWHADWEDALRDGLRYSRGMNYGLSQLWKEGLFKNYDAFFLLTNDSELPDSPTVAPLLEQLQEHKRVGLLSPCSQTWGEKALLEEIGTRYFWFIHNNAYLVRREFVEDICERESVNHMDFLFDGSNFRGYLSESELIAKGYANDWASAITNKVFVEENQSHLMGRADLIKTEPYSRNLELYLAEGKAWLKRKYGFNSRWLMQQYVKHFYDKFFEFHPEYLEIQGVKLTVHINRSTKS